jgi:hypothetical protein
MTRKPKPQPTTPPRKNQNRARSGDSEDDELLPIRPMPIWMRIRGHVKGAAIACVVVIIPVSIYYQRQPPIEVTSGYIEPEVATAGQCVTVHWEVRVKEDCPAEIEHEIVTGRGHIWALDAQRIMVQGSGIIRPSRTICIPWTVREAPAKYRQSIRFYCDPLAYYWPLVVKVPELPFYVKDNPKVDALNPPVTDGPPLLAKPRGN